MKSRPYFLVAPNRFHSGKAIIDAFRKLPADDAASVDSWLLWANSYGSMTHLEHVLYTWINEQEDGIHSDAADWRRGGHGG